MNFQAVPKPPQRRNDPVKPLELCATSKQLKKLENKDQCAFHAVELLLLVLTIMDDNTIGSGSGKDALPYDLHLMTEPYGVPCMVDIFNFL